MMKNNVFLGLLLISTGAMANHVDCSDVKGLWMGKFSYVNPAFCKLEHKEMCDKVSIAIGLKQGPEANTFVADIYPQRGVGASVLLQCENGKISVAQSGANLPPGIKISYQCDELDNCVVKYEDARLKSQLIKLWQEDARI